MSSLDPDFFFKRRFLLLGLGKIALMGGLLGRLIYLQGFRYKDFLQLSDKNRIFHVPIPPARGRIFDRLGDVMAGNRVVYQAFVNLYDVDDQEVFWSRLQKIFGNDFEPIAKHPRRKGMPVILHDHLTFEQLSRLELHRSDFPEIVCEPLEIRSYTAPYLTAHIIGYVGSPTAQQTIDDKDLNACPQIKVGKTGLESYWDQHLRGVSGQKILEVDATRRPIRLVEDIPFQSGKDLHLTLHRELQQKIYDLLLPHAPSWALVMEAQTGALWACVSCPTFDANLFSGPIPHHLWEALRHHPHRPLHPRITQGLYAPGSLFKMVTALAGIKAGVITPQTRVTCSGHTTLGDRRFHCWKWAQGGHGAVGLEQALAGSCDVYFYHIAQNISVEAITNMARILGYGNLTGIEIPHEKSGFLPSREWKHRVKGGSWTRGENLLLSIGQGYILATPLQMTKSMCLLVNGGRNVHPHLDLSYTPESAEIIDIPHEVLPVILSGLEGTVNRIGGTAYAHRNEKYPFAGKTATVQVTRISQRERNQKRLDVREWAQREHAFFVGYAPLTSPRWVVSVGVEHGGSGSKAATPLAKEIFKLLEK